MKKLKLKKSINFIEEYSALVCEIGEIHPINGTDRLGYTVTNGYEMVVNTEQCKKGDIMVFCPMETKLCENFLSRNNFYSPKYAEKNTGYQSMINELDLNKEEERERILKKYTGFFSINGRIKAIKIKGNRSTGIFITQKELSKWLPKVDFSTLSEYKGMSFDTVNKKELISVYLPKKKEEEKKPSQHFFRKRSKKLKKIKRIIKGTFSFHYDTVPFERYTECVNPETKITVTKKMNGTSFILSHIPIYAKTSRISEIIHDILFFLPRKKEYALVYASRNVIKNDDINPNKGEGFYDVDIYKDIANKFGKYVPRGFTIYGEAVGYLPNTNNPIQIRNKHEYIYGCNKGTYKIMPYRMSYLGKNGKATEVNVENVNKWINHLLEKHKELNGYLIPMKMYYHGKAGDLFDIDEKNNWEENFLESIRKSPLFEMEADDDTCPKGTPTEGIVIRKDNDPILEAFKVKCFRYMDDEQRDVDNGIYNEEI